MTLRQIVDVLWTRKWLIIIVVAVAMGVGTLYLQLHTATYSSSATVRENTTISAAAQSGELGGVQVDFDPTTITTSKILDDAADKLGVSPSSLSDSVSYSLGGTDLVTNIQIAATATTPEDAKARVTAVVGAYTAYLQKQVDTTVATITTRQQAAAKLASQYQQQVIDNPSDSISQASLQSALGNLGDLTNQIDSIKQAGLPLSVLIPAEDGTLIGPSLPIVLLIALAAGLIAGIGIALIRDQFDDRLRGEHELEELTGLPSLGELSYDRGVARAKNMLPAATPARAILNEGLRALRVAIQVLLPHEHSVIVISSVEPGDGKTFVSSNLAVTWARAGKRVILVGGDMRRPALPRQFGNDAQGVGLAELLRASQNGAPIPQAEIDSRLKQTRYPGLHVLPSGMGDEAAGDLLAAPGLHSVIERLRQLADIVVIDSPPAMAFVDATLLAENSDGVVLVAGIGSVNRSYLVTTVDLLKQNGIRVLGTVANRSRRVLPRSYVPYYQATAAARKIA